MRMTAILIVVCYTPSPKTLGKKTGELGNWRDNRDNPDHSSAKIGKNTLRSPGDLR